MLLLGITLTPYCENAQSKTCENASCGHVCDMEVFPQLVRPHPPSLFTPSCHPPQHGNLCQTNCFKTFCFSLVSLDPAQKEHLMVILEST